MSFGIHSSVQKAQDNETQAAEEPAPIAALPPSVITRLVIGCKRRVVVYTWVDGEAQETKVSLRVACEPGPHTCVKEVPLQHSPRAVAFFGPNAACLAYPANDYGILNILSMSATDIMFPAPTTTSVVAMGGRGMGMGALTGLFSAKVKPTAVSVNDREVLIIREGQLVRRSR
jgi:Vam6/Vps39-like protein vacuolar protein sorting-associated protein 39